MMFKDTNAFSGFSVDDLDRAKRFYGDTLGLDISENPAGLELLLGNGTRVFVYPKPNHEPATFTILNFMVENVEQAVDDLVASGVSIERYEGIDSDEKGITRGGDEGPTIAWFKDPAGNILSVLEQPA
jgi:catechol 2,3-dioxygenase-like lactoylglutathione lyase family enzyme